METFSDSFSSEGIERDVEKTLSSHKLHQKEQMLRKQMALEYAKTYEPPSKSHDLENIEEDFDLEKYPVKEWSFTLPGFKEPIAFNPITSLIGIGLLWGLAIWCMGKLKCMKSCGTMTRCICR